MNFHNWVPEEVVFYRLFPSIDFHDLIRVIPHVCSGWRRMIISKLETIHLYPNIVIEELDNHQYIKESPVIDLTVQDNLLPFIRYVIKFIRFNNMKIRYLFINGQVEDVMFRKQFTIFNSLQNVCDEKIRLFIPNRSQRQSIELNNRLLDMDGYFPNSLTEPALRRCALSSQTQNSYYYKLDEIMDSETFRSLLEVCEHVEVVSYSNLVARKYLVHLLNRAKVIIIDNSRVEDFLNEVHFKYSFFTNDFVPFGNYSSEYADSFPISSPIFYTSCKNLSFPSMTINQFADLCESTIADKDNESVEINISPNSYHNISESEVKQAFDHLCDYLSYSRCLKRVGLGLDFLLKLKRKIEVNYHYSGAKIEDLYIRKIGEGCSLVNLHTFISGFTNLNSIVLEDIKSKDCFLIRDSLLGMKELKSMRITFYDHQGDESKYFNFISSILSQHKKLTKFEFSFPYMDRMNDEAVLLTTLNESQGPCQILLKRLPTLSKKTLLLLEKVPQVEIRMRAVIDEDHSLPKIDYDQDIDTIRNQRTLFKQVLQHCEIVCPRCFKVLVRNSIDEHFSKYHTLPDTLNWKYMSKKVSNQVTCPCCKIECPKQELDEHLQVCENRNLKIKLENITNMKPLNHVYKCYGEEIKLDPCIPIRYSNNNNKSYYY